MPALCTVKVGGCLHWVDRPRQWLKLSLPDPDLESLEWSVCIETNGYKSHPEEPHSCTGWCWCGPVQSCVDSSCTNWECVPSELCTCLCTHTYLHMYSICVWPVWLLDEVRNRYMRMYWLCVLQLVKWSMAFIEVTSCRMWNTHNFQPSCSTFSHCILYSCFGDHLAVLMFCQLIGLQVQAQLKCPPWASPGSQTKYVSSL